MDDLIIIGAIIWFQIEIFDLRKPLPKIERDLEDIKDGIYKIHRDYDDLVYNKGGVKKYAKGTTQRVKE
jgi:hypothetical protein